jgi:hypothetical protein
MPSSAKKVKLRRLPKLVLEHASLSPHSSSLSRVIKDLVWWAVCGILRQRGAGDAWLVSILVVVLIIFGPRVFGPRGPFSN